MSTQTPDDLSPWNLDAQSEDGELHETSIDGSHEEQTAQETFQHYVFPLQRKASGTNFQQATSLPAPHIMDTSDLFKVRPGQISHLPVPGMTLIVTDGHSDPQIGPSEKLFTAKDNERWFFDNGACPVAFAAHGLSVIVHRPHWLTDNTIPEVCEAFGPVEICTINQATAKDRYGNLGSAYRLIKVRNEDHIAAQMFTDACRGVSSISTMLWVRPRYCYNPRVEDGIAGICRKRNLFYYVDNSDDKIVMF